MISYEDFKKVEIRAGKILSAEKVPNTDKLLRLTVDFAEFEEKPLASVGNEEVQNSSSAIIEDKEEQKQDSRDQLKAQIQKIPKIRQIISGISLHFPDHSVLVGKTCMFVTNLEPRMIKGFESNGMILAVSTKEGGFSLLEPNSTISPGTLAS